jgi:hypothetical protein
LMSILDGKPRETTAEHLKLKWGGSPENFRCRLCGHRFKVGDIWRFVFANFKDSGSNYGNFLVCVSCDGHDVLVRAAAQEQEARTRFWWLRRET